MYGKRLGPLSNPADRILQCTMGAFPVSPRALNKHQKASRLKNTLFRGGPQWGFDEWPIPNSTLKNIPWAVLFLQLLVKGGIAGVVKGIQKKTLRTSQDDHFLKG